MHDPVEVLLPVSDVGIYRDGDMARLIVTAESVPALLRALIAQAGGVEVEVSGYYLLNKDGDWADVPDGPAIVMPMEPT